MTSKPTTDVDLTAKDVRELISEDAICSFLPNCSASNCPV